MFKQALSGFFEAVSMSHLLCGIASDVLTHFESENFDRPGISAGQGSRSLLPTEAEAEKINRTSAAT
jgi:hypothetical protein